MLAFTLRTLYATKKSKVLSGLIGNEWEDRIVTQLTTSMSDWKSSLPQHRLYSSLIYLTTTADDVQSALEPRWTESYILPSIFVSTCHLLLHPNTHSSAFPDQKITLVVSSTGKMHSCCQSMCGYDGNHDDKGITDHNAKHHCWVILYIPYALWLTYFLDSCRFSQPSHCPQHLG